MCWHAGSDTYRDIASLRRSPRLKVGVETDPTLNTEICNELPVHQRDQNAVTIVS